MVKNHEITEKTPNIQEKQEKTTGKNISIQCISAAFLQDIFYSLFLKYYIK